MVNIMDCCMGGELLDYVKERKRLTEAEAKKIMRQVLSGIQYCHKEFGLIHRDLKLENVLLVEKGKLDIKIIDFGIAGVQAGVHTDVDNPGSLLYLPPEALRQSTNAVAPAWDIWAMGVMLFAMICGEMPFQGTIEKEIVNGILKEKY